MEGETRQAVAVEPEVHSEDRSTAGVVVTRDPDSRTPGGSLTIGQANVDRTADPVVWVGEENAMAVIEAIAEVMQPDADR